MPLLISDQGDMWIITAFEYEWQHWTKITDSRIRYESGCGQIDVVALARIEAR
jgi:hypothetical protein